VKDVFGSTSLVSGVNYSETPFEVIVGCPAGDLATLASRVADIPSALLRNQSRS